MSSEFNEKNYSSKMDKSIQSLKKDLSTLRTGRANPNMLEFALPVLNVERSFFSDWILLSILDE